ncbi:MAG: cyclopropane-fatty-acyl-phospholipid synthase family protein, partial [Gammaproteobacteria bacterium]|nr:cyclopropane-fatty-acyl-phospholipid synthase family protein [Gammaproteobacteria bacterium]
MNTRAEVIPRGHDGRYSRLDELYRSLVHRKLASLADGRLSIADWKGHWEYGRGGVHSAEIKVTDRRFYRALVFGGSLGAAQAYINGWWDTSDLARLFRLFVVNAQCADGMDNGLARTRVWMSRVGHHVRANTRLGSRSNISEHYDLGNDFFALMLDPSMTYSSGFYADEDASLYDAQHAKLDRICRKLRLCHEHHVLEIGSGWGSFAIHAASRYGCRVTTTTISDNQYQAARERIAAAGVGDRVKLLTKDYRELDGRYDRIVSIEMIEAVGHRFLPAYFGKVAQLLKP